MPEDFTEDTTIIRLVEAIDCNVSSYEVQEKAAAYIRVLLLKYTESEYPTLYKQIKDLEENYRRMIGMYQK
jgi:hypothetical protein